MTRINIDNHDISYINDMLAGVQGFSWLFTWGMFVFLLVTLAILFWIFYDSITKGKDQKALVPRIMAIIGFFLVIPAFIFRYTGNADGVSVIVSALDGDLQGAIPYNVLWLVAGYGPLIAIIALLGVVVSIAAIVIYASSVQRAKMPTDFMNAYDARMSSLEREVKKGQSGSAADTGAAAASAAFGKSVAANGGSRGADTIFDRKPVAATIMDVPKSGDTLTIQSGSSRGKVIDLPAGTVVIGRDTSADIVIDDGKVSRQHVRLVYNNGTWTAVDLGSVNGTYHNGSRLVGQERVSNGDTIRVGDTTLTFGTSA